jgi:calcineurin-like phosphoesterase family protein
MYNKHKFYHNNNQKVWWISDTHFRHDRDFILSKRGFDTITEHDEFLIEDWNEKVSTSDTVMHVGDFLLGAGQKSREVAEEIINRLNGNVCFLWGNHNAGVKPIYIDLVRQVLGEKTKLNKNIQEVYPLRMKTDRGSFTYYGHYLLESIDYSGNKMVHREQLVFHSHFAHRLWIDGHKGHVWHVSGHSHGSDPESQPDYPFHKRVDAGVENFGGVISFEELSEVMKKKQTVSIDHHDKSTSPSF